MIYYHVSKKKGLKVLKPKIPKNQMTKEYGEDSKIPRICVCPSINQCLNATGMFKFNEKLYVYAVDYANAYKPSKVLLPDADCHDEHWILEKVDCKMLYEIKMIRAK